DRLGRRDEVDGLVGDWTRAMPRAAVIERCLAAEVPIGPINDIEEIFADPQYAARDNLLKLVEEGLGEIVIPGVVPKLSRTPGSVRTLGPALGSATDDVLGRLLGYSASQ